MLRSLYRILPLCAVLAAPLAIGAQEPADTVAVDSAAPAPPPPPPAPPEPEPAPDRWRAAVDLGFNAATGNTRLAVLSTTLRIEHLQTETLELEWAATYRYGESRGDVVARSASTSLNLDIRPASPVSPFAFAIVERDPFRRLDVRSNTGSGVKYTLYSRQRDEASISVAALYSHEAFTSDQPTRRDARWSVRGKVAQRLGGAARIESTAFYKPVWDHGGDYNIQLLNKLSSKITERLAMTFSHEYLLDSTPPDGVAREDQRFQAGATLEFF